MSELSRFILEKNATKIEAGYVDAMLDGMQPHLKPITIRLPIEMVKTLDNISTNFDISRQELSYQILESGISEILDSLAKDALERRYQLPENIDDEEYKRLLLAEKTNVIKELVG